MIRLLAHYLRPYSLHVTAVLLLQLTQAVASLFLPTLNATIIDDGVATGDTATIWRLGGVMLLVSVLQIGAQVGAIWFGARAAMSFGRDLRGAIFEHGLAFSARELGRFGAPTLITRNTNDVQQVQMLVLMTATMIVSAPLTAVGGIFMALREDIGLSWLILAAIVALGALIGVLAGLVIAAAVSAVGIPMPPPPNANVGYTAYIRIIPAEVLTAAAIGLFATTLAALLPARRASASSIVDALRQGT